ncbi:flavin reductase [Rhodococcus rhodochrous]|uniref:flavin reductase family protein n=1 Tax=Rhodococcus rhodochrous TaxID=1829 RepID=UPI0007518B4B|nr:flavin reductase family protein [Rhodococcus rhodochrous]MDO1485112.1 flavin reductase family protein [Rhodococcus rhodochrous]SNV10063.1 flavin reductase [Rhodococcus rhodochrous]
MGNPSAGLAPTPATWSLIEFDDRTAAQKQGLLSHLVVPRPIAMITTLGPAGELNVAPYSYYMPVCGEPPTIAITIGGIRTATDEPKDTWSNIERTGEFVVNLTNDALAPYIETVAREYPVGVDEAAIAGWEGTASRMVAAPSLVQSPAHLECRVREVIDRGDLDVRFSGFHLVLAEVLCITVDESLLAEPGRIDPEKVTPIGRMGFPYFVTATGDALFQQERIEYADLPADAR